MKKLFVLIISIAFSSTGYSQLQSPSEFLPHELGAQFTPHHLLVDYMQHVAASSDWVNITEYGKTSQDRPLLLAHIGKPENLERLDAIRTNNLKRTGVIAGATTPELDDIAVIWISFGVHGNEAAGPESAMEAMYQLLNHPDRDQWLDRMVICYDPTLNPDGYDRYSHWYRNVSNDTPDPNPRAREHDEPWPGGRVNHYLFDLNRDWAWQTQAESRQRMKIYNEWLPQVHVDVHEQGYNSPYYFAPAAPPYHEYITDWQSEFQVTIGKNHARYFDEQGWLFFTKERFDLLYPSYGDTYPTYNGAIGMTYEQGGIGAGLAIQLNNGDTLTLYDRIAHHTTTVLSTIEICSQHTNDLIREFTNYWQSSQQNPPGDYTSFVISGENPAGRIKSFCQLLDRNGIIYGSLDAPKSIEAYNYQTGKTERIQVSTTDLVVSAHQPKAVLTQILLEPETYLEDSITYDITAWSLPYAYGLRAFASNQKLVPTIDYSPAMGSSTLASRPYAYLLPWNDLSDARFLAKALEKGLMVRYAEQPFRINDKDYDRGTLVFTRADNRKKPRFDQTIRSLMESSGTPLETTTTGFAQAGPDLGSGAYRFIEAPKVLLLGGESSSTLSFGQAWYFFEQDINYPVHIRDADQLSGIDLDAFNTLILVDGRYRMNENVKQKLKTWLRSGGHLIAIGSANSSLSSVEGLGLKRATRGESDREDTEINETPDYAGQERRSISNYIPGAIFRVDMDGTHPLAYGIGDHYFSLKTSSGAFAPSDNGWNVGQIGADPMVIGFAGQNARKLQENSAVQSVQSFGRGTVTYLVDNPLFRSFWENGKFLFSNALFFVNN